jgi:nickel/cobalt exporter
VDPVATDLTFAVALQFSIMLGIIHGIIPCEHSWPLLVPFCITAQGMKKCIKVWFYFCAGTTSACALLGVVWGALGSIIPSGWNIYFGIGTAGILVILGIILILRPHWLHFEEEGEEETIKQAFEHSQQALERVTDKKRFKHGIYWGMFSIGFINMIMPCPTAGVMYTYALVSKSVFVGMTIFFAYALSTSLVLLIITYFLGKATFFFKNLGREKYEVLLTRISGALIAAFGMYMMVVESEPLFFG